MNDKQFLQQAVQKAKDSAAQEGTHNITAINSDSTHTLELVYMPDFEVEMLELVKKWEKQQQH